MSKPVENRYEFVLLFDVENGNPNGDPDAGNMPRIDPETNFGIVTDVCLKRKIRDYVLVCKERAPRYDIFIKQGVILNQLIESAYSQSIEVREALEEWKTWQKNKKKATKPTKHYEDIAKNWMCDNFFDVRTFGAVMSTGSDKGDASTAESSNDTEASGRSKSKIRMTAGQVRGPVQMNFAKSVEEIVPRDISMSRVCAASEDNPEQFGLGPRKSIVPYGLYRAEGYISAHLAKQTGFNDDDLSLLWKALTEMFDHDRSAARGKMTTRALVAFRHDSAMGNAPAHALLERFKVLRETSGSPARSFADYKVDLDEANMPKGVTAMKLLWP
ncbi:MAG: type I-C CRISPR-associated protein Cas7/Csd2 [candidate division Zixibacteria bacterium]|nr:type I-C CRISPR-associated protein Cas7/Csd2 [candidate division Zixibacteria bacterium]MBU1471514.1 type I-C CRISPR-associated protein Cas7/Csd2 [candidate division Zixibacteria bacterium]MBU2626545.1 type I-C CRISPR-associated protein Cas7/Csd2 [candidate division Zixibacteria bacterium]